MRRTARSTEAEQAAQLIPLIEYSFIIERKPPVSIIADCPMQGMMCKHGLTAALFYNIFRLGATGFDKNSVESAVDSGALFSWKQYIQSPFAKPNCYAHA